MNTMTTIKTKDMVTMAEMGTTKCSSVIYFILNPSKDSEKAIEYLVTINDVTIEEVNTLRRFCEEHEVLLRKLKAMGKSRSKQYCEYCSVYGEELVDFLMEVIQQC